MNSRVHRRLELLDTKARRVRIKGLRGGVAAEINITPLVDVVLVLLIIFMLVLPEMDVVINLPEAFNPEKITAAKTPPMNISVKCGKLEIIKEGERKGGRQCIGHLVSVNNGEFVPVEVGSLKELLEKELKRDPFAIVYLAADENMEFKDIRAILTALRDAGVAQAGLVSKRITEQEN